MMTTMLRDELNVGKRKASVWCPSVQPSDCMSRLAYTQSDSLGGSMGACILLCEGRYACSSFGVSYVLPMDVSVISF